jgi:hypothetical protein
MTIPLARVFLKVGWQMRREQSCMPEALPCSFEGGGISDQIPDPAR